MKNFLFAVRYLLKSRGNNLSRLLSLMFGVGVGVLIFSYVNYTLSFNRFLPDSNRIYQMMATYSSLGVETESQQMNAPYAPALYDEFAEVEAATRTIGAFRYDFKYGDNAFPMEFYAADTMFFDVFDFGVVSGNPKELLLDKGNIMLSESIAKAIFGNDDPIGKVMTDNNDNEVTVCGLFRDPPLNNSLGEFNSLCSFERISGNFNTGWNGGDSFQTFVKLRRGARIADVEGNMDRIYDKYGLKENMAMWNQRHFFVPITRAILHEGTRRQYVNLFVMLTILVIFVASMNYVLISISTLFDRSRTIAMLRCNGAQKWDVFKIFLSETLLLMFVGLALDALVIVCCKAPIEHLTGTTLSALFSVQYLGVALLLVTVAFLLAALIPALLFTSVPLTVAFKGVVDNRRGWKKILLGLQLVCAAFTVTFLLVSIAQFDRLKNGDCGYKHDKLVYVNLLSNYDQLLNHEASFAALPCVEAAGSSYSLPMWGYSGQPCYDDSTHEMLFSCRIDCVSPTYFDAMGMKIVKGKGFKAQSPQTDVVVNEEYLRLRSWDAASALGRTIIDDGSPQAMNYTIVGVVNNVRVGASSGEILPIVYHPIHLWMYDEPNRLSGGMRTMIRLKELTPEAIEEVAKKLDEYQTIDHAEITVYDEKFGESMKGETAFKNVMIMVCVSIFLITLIGLFGYLNDEIQRRSKEVAIRKVNGATVRNVLLMMAANLSYVVLPSVAIGLAASWFVADRWLRQFANRTPLYWWLFVCGAVAVMVVVYGVQLIKTWRIATSNPIKMIKTE